MLRSSATRRVSPASPAANRGWAEAVDAKLAALGVT
jgi:hypothetical protein